MINCSICNDEGGVYDRKLNAFTPCSCLESKKNEYRFEKSGLPIKFWDLDIEEFFPKQYNVIEQFLEFRKKIRKDNLIVKCPQFNLEAKFMYLSCKKAIESDVFPDVQVVSFSNLLLDIIQQWSKQSSQSEVLLRYRFADLLFIVDLDISLLRENMNQLVFVDLLQYRENNKLSTIIGTNTDRETLCNNFNLDLDCYAEYKLKSEK